MIRLPVRKIVVTDHDAGTLANFKDRLGERRFSIVAIGRLFSRSNVLNSQASIRQRERPVKTFSHFFGNSLSEIELIVDGIDRNALGGSSQINRKYAMPCHGVFRHRPRILGIAERNSETQRPAVSNEAVGRSEFFGAGQSQQRTLIHLIESLESFAGIFVDFCRHTFKRHNGAIPCELIRESVIEAVFVETNKSKRPLFSQGDIGAAKRRSVTDFERCCRFRACFAYLDHRRVASLIGTAVIVIGRFNPMRPARNHEIASALQRICIANIGRKTGFIRPCQIEDRLFPELNNSLFCCIEPARILIRAFKDRQLRAIREIHDGRMAVACTQAPRARKPQRRFLRHQRRASKARDERAFLSGLERNVA